MKKIFISILLMSFVFNFANAEEVKQTKEVKQMNKKELSEEDRLIAEFIKSNNESKELDKVEKTLDKLNKQLEKDKK